MEQNSGRPGGHAQRHHIWRTHNVWAFSLASLFSDWGHEMVTALMPGFLTTLGAPAVALGLTEGISNLVQAWTAVWGGQVSDHQAHRHRVLIAGYTLTGFKVLLAAVYWWPWVVVLRTVAWAGRGARGPIRDAYIAEEVAPEHVGKAYGLREAFDTAGALLGPLCAALFAAYTTPRALIAWTAVPAVVTIVIALTFKKLPGRPSNVNRIGADKGHTRGWSRRFIRYRAASALFACGYLAPTFFILRVWQSRQGVGPLSAHTVALLLYTLHNAVYAASAYPVGRLADRMPGRTMLGVGYGLWTVTVAGFFLVANGVGWWIGLFALAGLATGMIEVGQKITTVRIVSAAQRGQGLGQIAAVRGMGQLLAGLIMGILWTLSGSRAGFGTEAGLALLGSLAMIWATGRPGEPADQPA